MADGDILTGENGRDVAVMPLACFNEGAYIEVTQNSFAHTLLPSLSQL